MKKTIISIQKIAFAFSFVALGFTACKKEAKAPETATVIFQHASPDMSSVNITVDGKQINTAALAYTNNTGYLTVNAGERVIKINNATTGGLLLTKTITLTKDKKYTLMAANRLANLETVLLEDVLSVAVTGKAHLRVLNISPDAPAFNVTITGSTTNIFSNAAFKTATSFSTFDAAAAGTAISFQVKNPTTNAVVTTVNETLMPGKVYTLVVRGFVTPPTGNTNTIGSNLVTNR